MMTRHTKAGCKAISAATGDDAIELYRREPITMVLVDIFMPDKGQLEVCRAFPEAKLIAMSDHPEYCGLASREERASPLIQDFPEPRQEHSGPLSALGTMNA